MDNKALQLAEPLLTSSDSPSGVPGGFITDFVNRFENDGLADVCSSCVCVDFIVYTSVFPPSTAFSSLLCHSVVWHIRASAVFIFCLVKSFIKLFILHTSTAFGSPTAAHTCAGRAGEGHAPVLNSRPLHRASTGACMCPGNGRGGGEPLALF